jgi:hypothetical protein
MRFRMNQWERIKDCVPGGTKGKRAPAHEQPAVPGRAVVDRPFRRSLA